MIRLNLDVRVEAEGALAGHIGLRLADVLLVEQKLPVQVAHVDRVQIDLKKEAKENLNKLATLPRKMQLFAGYVALQQVCKFSKNKETLTISMS